MLSKRFSFKGRNASSALDAVEGIYRPIKIRKQDQLETRTAHFLLGTESKYKNIILFRNQTYFIHLRLKHESK